MAKDEEAAKTMGDLNGKEVSGRALRVNEATPKRERGTRGSGFGSGRGGRDRFLSLKFVESLMPQVASSEVEGISCVAR